MASRVKSALALAEESRALDPSGQAPLGLVGCLAAATGDEARAVETLTPLVESPGPLLTASHRAMNAYWLAVASGGDAGLFERAALLGGAWAERAKQPA